MVVFKIYFRISFYGNNNLPAKGKYILAANHTSFLDPPLVASSTWRRINFMARDDLFKSRFFGNLITCLGAFKVNRGKTDRTAIKHALELLARGEALLLFPQGTRHKQITMDNIHSGVGFLAKKSNAPVIPVYIKGADQALGRKMVFPRPRHIKIYYGRPIRFKNGHYREFAGRVVDSIARLKEA